MTTPHPSPFAFTADLGRRVLTKLPEHVQADPLSTDRPSWLRYRIALLERDVEDARDVDPRAASKLSQLLIAARAELTEAEEREMLRAIRAEPTDVLEALAWGLPEDEAQALYQVAGGAHV